MFKGNGLSLKKIEILYEDETCLIVNKPAGLAVQGGAGVKTSLDKLLSEIRNPAPLLVHRLDKDTSGVIIVAKTKEAAAKLSNLLGKERKAVKKYIAVAAGCPEKKHGVIIEDLKIKNTIKKSETKYTVIGTQSLLSVMIAGNFFAGKIPMANVSTFAGLCDPLRLPGGVYNGTGELELTPYSVLELELGTGRMHQIRRHLALTGNPILGDDKYGDFKLNKQLHKGIGLKRLLLHASKLTIPDFNIDIEAPLPEYFYPFYR